MQLSQQKIEKLEIEARARITWGDSPADVREWLLNQGVNNLQTDEILREFLAERGASMRKRGLQNVIVGVGAIALAVGIGFAPRLLGEVFDLAFRRRGWFMAGGGLLGIYGAKQLADGIERLLMGARASGADSDVEDD
jgi:hypothetical protein